MPTADTFLGDRLLVRRAYVELEAAWAHFARLRDEIAWQQPGYAHARGVTRLPRLTANYGERSYDYGKLAFAPVPWTPLLRELQQLAEREAGVAFNAAIIQQYRDGADRVNWHADDSPLVGRDQGRPDRSPGPHAGPRRPGDHARRPAAHPPAQRAQAARRGATHQHHVPADRGHGAANAD
jgi:hypothetical protein